MTLVIPVHYEEESIGVALAALHATVREPFKALVVYDVDEDPTVAVVRDGAVGWPEAELLQNAFGRGVLGALKTGFAASESEYTLVFMADLSDDPEVVNAMVAVADEGYDVVSGSRYMKGGAKVGGPVIKSFLSRTAGRSLHLLTRIPTHDATNALRLYRTSFLRETPIESVGGFEVTMELTIKAYLEGRRLAEVPATWRDRAAGKSKFSFRRWLPHYVRWYLYAIVRSPFGLRVVRPRPIQDR